jgi:hypothetical protein
VRRAGDRGEGPCEWREGVEDEREGGGVSVRVGEEPWARTGKWSDRARNAPKATPLHATPKPTGRGTRAKTAQKRDFPKVAAGKHHATRARREGAVGA